MIKYESYKNYVNISKFTDVTIKLTDGQKSLVNSLIFEIGQLESLFLKDANLDINSSIWLMNFINLEGQSSSLIEGTNTHFEDLSYDIEGINDVFQWETRNLLTLYNDCLNRINEKTFFLSVDSLRDMHIRLYNSQSGEKFRLLFNPSTKIEQIKPGWIISNDKTPNWIGAKVGKTLEEKMAMASLIPVKPSLKIKYLNDLLNTLNYKTQNKELTIEDLIKFHPIFEAIHPFSDGNGRLGRLILTLLFKLAGIGNHVLINFSDVILKNKEAYFNQLKQVQLNDQWDEWTSYFISLLIDIKHNLQTKIKKMNKIWNYYFQNPEVQKSEARKIVLKYFFKYYKIHKTHTIKKMIAKGVPQAQAYRAFDFIVDFVKPQKENNYYSFEEIKKIMLDK